MPHPTLDAEKANVRKIAQFIVACGMKMLKPDETNEWIFTEAETFVAEAEKRYGLPLPD